METRIRRGKVVTIPEEWRGKVTRRQTIRKRVSKMTRKDRNSHPHTVKAFLRGSKRDRIEAKSPTINEFMEE